MNEDSVNVDVLKIEAARERLSKLPAVDNARLRRQQPGRADRQMGE